MLDGVLSMVAEEQRVEAKYRKKMEEEAKSRADGNRYPRHFALKSRQTDKYLRYVNYDDNESFDGLLQFTGDKMISPYTKFEFVYSSVKGFYHIRCCYNNRYLVRRDQKSSYIVATATEPINDPNDWRCTLFEPYYYTFADACKVSHRQLNQAIRVHESTEVPNIPLAANPDGGPDYNRSHAFFTFADWDSIYVLPKYVAFKGGNGNYLKFNWEDVLSFSGTDSKDPTIAYEIIPAKDGSVHIRDVEFGTLWIRTRRGWISGKKLDANSTDPDTLFWPFKVNDKIVAFRNRGNDRFCVITTGYFRDCLNADSSLLTSQAHMEVVELVASRTIDNVVYKLHDATVYGQKVLSMAKGDAINKTNETDTVTFKFYYEKKLKTTWTSTLSAKVGVTTKFKLDGIPIIGSANVEVSMETEKEYSWGETQKHKDILELTYPVTVPPNSRVEINAVVKQGMCKVPFSYRRTDVFHNGKRVVHTLHDGIFTGVNSYDYEFMSKAVPMESEQG